MSELILGIDTGGTYTDGVLLDYHTREVLATTKTLTTRHDLTECILKALADLLSENNGTIRLISISTTLATNAIAEGKGRPVALFLLGYDPALVKQFRLESEFATDNFYYFEGGHTLHGEEQTPLALAAILEQAATLKESVEAFAVSAYFSPFNPSHEQRAFKALREATGKPVVLGHQLASKLNSIQRATTATLNASLLSILQDFILAIRKSLDEHTITAPLMMVRGNGALMSADIAENLPVETVHSGPAASAIGARFLTGIDRAVVIDIGGTTTDIAIIDGGQVNVREEGTTVGNFRTAVRAADIRSIGLGGDSLISYDVDERIRVGPSRVTPLAYLASQHSQVAHEVKHLAHHSFNKRSPDSVEYWFLQREPRRFVKNDLGRQVIEMLRQRPMALPEILDRLGIFHPLQFGGQTLIKEEIIGRAALTPTDLLHANGEYTPWDQEAAKSAAKYIASLKGYSVAELIEQVMTTIAERITAEVIAFVSKQSLRRVPDYLHPDDLGLWLFEENLYKSHPYLGSEISLKIPIIGIGAPAAIFLPRVAEHLHTRLIIPPHFQVANAVGAISGSVMIHHEAWVYPQSRGMHVVGYFVQSSQKRQRFSRLSEALDYARQIIGERAKDEALAAGAVDPHIEFEQLPDGAESYRLRARAIGNPQLG